MSTRVIDRQLGASGKTFHKGEVWNDADYNPDFHSQAGLAILDEMATSDADIDGCISRIVLPLVAATWTVQPYSEKGEEPTPEDHEHAQWMQEMLFESEIAGGGFENPCEQLLEETLRSRLVYGHAARELVWGVDSRGRQVIAKLAAHRRAGAETTHPDEKSRPEPRSEPTELFSFQADAQLPPATRCQRCQRCRRDRGSILQGSRIGGSIRNTTTKALQLGMGRAANRV